LERTKIPLRRVPGFGEFGRLPELLEGRLRRRSLAHRTGVLRHPFGSDYGFRRASAARWPESKKLHRQDRTRDFGRMLSGQELTPEALHAERLIKGDGDCSCRTAKLGRG
jgi:hypothetical protein